MPGLNPTARLSCFLLFAFAAISCSQGKNKVFGFNPEPDSLYTFTVTTMPGFNDIDVHTAESFRFSLRCTGQEDSVRKLALRILGFTSTRRMTVMSKAANGQITMRPSGVLVTLSTDSAAPDESSTDFIAQTWLRLIRRTVGKTLSVTINQRGEVLRVSGYRQIAAQLAASGHADPMTVNHYLRGYIGDESVRDLLHRMFFYLPARNMRPGDRWVKNVLFEARAPVKHSYLISMVKKQGDSVGLSVHARVSATTGEGGRVYLNGEAEGTFTADAVTGLPLWGEITDLSTTQTDRKEYTRQRRLQVIQERH